jgi:hypothetical protein
MGWRSGTGAIRPLLEDMLVIEQDVAIRPRERVANVDITFSSL